MRPFKFSFAAMLLTGVLLTGCNPNPQTDPLADGVDMTGQAVPRQNDPVVARVEGTEIYHTDVERSAMAQGLISDGESLETDDPVFRTVIDALIDQRLLALDARRDGVAQTEEARRRLAAARERILGNLRIEAHLADEVTEASIRDLYERQRALGNRGEERRARQIVVADQEVANAILSMLDDEEDFGSLVAEYSIDEATVNRDGDLGWSSRDMLGAPLRVAIFQTPVGGRVGPIETEEGWAIIEVLDQRTPGELSFEEVREDIERFMTFQAVDSLMTDLRDSGEVERLYEASADQAESDAQ